MNAIGLQKCNPMNLSAKAFVFMWNSSASFFYFFFMLSQLATIKTDDGNVFILRKSLDLVRSFELYSQKYGKPW